MDECTEPQVIRRIEEIKLEIEKPENSHYKNDIYGIINICPPRLSLDRVIGFIATHPVIWEQSNRIHLKSIKTSALDYLETFKEYERERARDEVEHQSALAEKRGRVHTSKDDEEIWHCMQGDVAMFIANFYDVRSNVDPHN